MEIPKWDHTIRKYFRLHSNRTCLHPEELQAGRFLLGFFKYYSPSHDQVTMKIAPVEVNKYRNKFNPHIPSNPCFGTIYQKYPAHA